MNENKCDEKFQRYLKDLKAELPSWYKEDILRRHPSIEMAVKNFIRKVKEGEKEELTANEFSQLTPGDWSDEDVMELLLNFCLDIREDGVWAFRDSSGERWELWVDEWDKLALVRISAFQAEAIGFEPIVALKPSGIDDFRLARRVKNRRSADPPDTYEEFKKFRRNQ